MSTPAADAALAALVFAVDPHGCGGVCLRGLPGTARDSFVNFLRDALPDKTPMRRLPLSVSEQRLLGGLDLSATLRAGRPIAETGVLAEADGGVLLLPMAERIDPRNLNHLATTLDTGEVVTARDGVSQTLSARLGMIAFDEGLEEGEGLDAKLLDRFAFHIDLTDLRAIDPEGLNLSVVPNAAARLPAMQTGDDILAALCSTALALGVMSVRACLLALRVARIVAALDGRDVVDMADAAVAARLVLSPRATQIPASDAQAEDDSTPAEVEPEPEQSAQPDAPDPADQSEDNDGNQNGGEVVLDAAKAAIPAGLLAQLQSGQASRVRSRSVGKSGALRPNGPRGRPAGVRRDKPGPNKRLNLIQTLRAAAPWQRLRHIGLDEPKRLRIHPDDFHVTSFRPRSETTTIFVIDSSGSAAANRLAEAKGAVELLLADCYIRRDKVAVIAFRGCRAELLLPPTRSLVRAKRSLAGLPGGGGTPLAAGIAAAAQLADSIQRRGGTPVIVLLTDGRANVATDGSGDRARADSEARDAAAVLRAAGVRTLLVDTSPRPAAQARALAAAMAALYLPLPYADASSLARAARHAA